MPLWGGRFEGGLDPLAMQLNASLAVDRRLWDADIRGSVAWARALARAQVISVAEAEALCNGLQAVWAEFCGGAFGDHADDEDIHSAVERRLGEIVGEAAGKLHTGRSRNDQVATDFRLWVREALDDILQRVAACQRALVIKAQAEFGTLMPGYTHTQRAQPVLFSHWLMSHFWALQRDRERLTQARARANVMPLGSGALAGTAFNIDRQRLAADLGFDEVSPNSLDAVADRDFALDFLFAAATIGVHLSRLAESLILFSSTEFGFVEISDAFATGSSLMPQKKNPDMLELARGKAGTLTGLLTGLFGVLKGLPSAYDKDLQEDKAPVFAAFDALALLLPVVAGTVVSMRVDASRMESSIDAGMLATELADFLVRRGVAFRQAHHLVGRAVRLGLSKGKPIDELTLGELQSISPVFDSADDIRAVFSARAAVEARAVVGGTSSNAVRAQIARAQALMAA